MKYLKYIAVAGVAFLAFALGLWLFAPWQSAGIYALDFIRLNSARNGVYMNYDDYESVGVFRPVYQVGKLDIENPFSKVTMSDVTIRVSPLSSLLSGGPVCHVEFAGADVAFLPNNSLTIGRGSAHLAATGDLIQITDANVEGDLQVTGDITYSRGPQRGIRHSTLLLKVPDNINAMLSSPLLSRYVESENPGEWRIKYAAANQ